MKSIFKRISLFLLICVFSLVVLSCEDTSKDGNTPTDGIVETPSTEDLKNGIQTVAPYKVYKADGTEFDGVEYTSMYTAIRTAAQNSSSKQKMYVLDANNLEIFRRQSKTNYWCYSGTKFYGSMPKAEAEVWAKNFTKAYVIDGQGLGNVLLGTEWYEGSDIESSGPLELFSGGYNYLFSTSGQLAPGNVWEKPGWGYLEGTVRLSQASYMPTNDGDGWNAYIFFNGSGGFLSDLGMIGAMRDGKVVWALVRNCSHTDHKTDEVKYGSSFTVLSWDPVTTMTWNEEKGRYDGADDLFFQCWQGVDGWIFKITNLTTNKVYTIEEIHEGMFTESIGYFRFLVAASYCPVVSDVWNARCGAYLRNVIFEDLKMARWNEAETYTEDMYEDFFVGENMSYGYSQGAECSSVEYGVRENGTKYISMSCYYDGLGHYGNGQ